MMERNAVVERRLGEVQCHIMDHRWGLALNIGHPTRAHMSLGTNAYTTGAQPTIFDYPSTIRILAGTHSDGAVIGSLF